MFSAALCFPFVVPLAYLCVLRAFVCALSRRSAAGATPLVTGASESSAVVVASSLSLSLAQCGRFPRSVACDNVPGRHDGDDRTLTLG